jgi:integrase
MSGGVLMITDAKARTLSPSEKPILDTRVPGLYLFPSTDIGNGKWILRYTSPKLRKRRDMGLGRYPHLSIKVARELAWSARQLIEQGIDPLEAREKEKEAQRRLDTMPTFEDAARVVYEDLAPGFRNAKHSAQWITSLEKLIFPKLGRKRVNELVVSDFAAALKGIWLTKAETASRVLQRCDRIMNWCVANGYIVASPVAVVPMLLPKQPSKKQRVQHHPAVPWRELPEVYRQQIVTGFAVDTRLMLEILILSATRSGEVRLMEWSEIDFEKAIWTIPAKRMKAKLPHRVPITPRMFEILQYKLSRTPSGTGLVFATSKGKPYTDMIFTTFLRKEDIESDVQGRAATAHGFRSTFRDWASENGYPRDVAERALAHTISNSTEAAYHRTDLLDKRRDMMGVWEEFLVSAEL